ncbi:MAG: peptidase, partial [Actinomycetota bacterium]|nr:peptidase [Actinomycetota bacterium]
ARRARRRRRAARLLRRALFVVVVAAVLGSAWIANRDRDSAKPPRGAPHSDVTSSEVTLAGGVPPPSTEEQPLPIGIAPPLPDERGPYRFARLQPSSSDPVSYDPCRPVHVVVNPRAAPAEHEELLRTALERVNEATGLKFVVDGVTDETPSPNRAPYQPARYPGRWAPVLVAWSDEAEDGRLAGDVAGYGGSISFSAAPGRPSVYVTGQLVLDGAQIDSLLDRAGGVAAARAVILHELAHVVGLDHVDDPSQIMNAVGSRAVTDYAAGDRTGLALLGRGHCFAGV